MQKTSGSGIENKIISNKELAEKLYKPIIRNFKKRKEHSIFIGKAISGVLILLICT